MKFFPLSTLALTISLSFGATMPAEANVYELLLQKKHHHTHQQHHQNRHSVHDYSHSNHRVNYSRHRNHHRLNRRVRGNSSRKRVRVFNPQRRHNNWRIRH